MNIRLIVAAPMNPLIQDLPSRLGLAEGSTVDDALDLVTKMLRESNRLPESSLLAVSGTFLGTVKSHRGRQLRDNDELEIIAPASGG